MIRRPPRSTPLYSSAASDVYKRQLLVGSLDERTHTRNLDELGGLAGVLPRWTGALVFGALASQCSEHERAGPPRKHPRQPTKLVQIPRVCSLVKRTDEQEEQTEYKRVTHHSQEGAEKPF